MCSAFFLWNLDAVNPKGAHLCEKNFLSLTQGQTLYRVGAGESEDCGVNLGAPFRNGRGLMLFPCVEQWVKQSAETS